MNDPLKPRPYDLDDPKEIRRLLWECKGYLQTCRRDHHGTDLKGRQYAMEALDEFMERYPKEPTP